MTYFCPADLYHKILLSKQITISCDQTNYDDNKTLSMQLHSNILHYVINHILNKFSSQTCVIIITRTIKLNLQSS